MALIRAQDYRRCQLEEPLEVSELYDRLMGPVLHLPAHTSRYEDGRISVQHLTDLRPIICH